MSITSKPLGHIRPETTPLFPSSVYTFENLHQVEAYYAPGNPEPGYLYRRNAHPNDKPVADTISRLENAEATTLCSSGMAAISQACFALLRPGQHVLATRHFYGGTYAFFEQILRPWGVDITYVDLNDQAALKNGVRENTRLIFAESIANPLLQVTDLPMLGNFAKQHGLMLLVDNTFATPLLVRPIELGATLSIHSLTKYLNGHSDVVGGSVTGEAEAVAKVQRFSVAFGGTLSPFDAWMTERGLKTLELRFAAQCDNALHLAAWLSSLPQVKRVFYPGLPEHETHHVAKRVLQGGFGAMVSFELAGGFDAANKLIEGLRHIAFAPSLGGVHTTVSHPATTSHRAYTAAERKELGIEDGLIRLSVGAEALDLIRGDLDTALQQL